MGRNLREEMENFAKLSRVSIGVVERCWKHETRKHCEYLVSIGGACSEVYANRCGFCPSYYKGCPFDIFPDDDKRCNERRVLEAARNFLHDNPKNSNDTEESGGGN